MNRIEALDEEALWHGELTGQIGLAEARGGGLGEGVAGDGAGALHYGDLVLSEKIRRRPEGIEAVLEVGDGGALARQIGLRLVLDHLASRVKDAEAQGSVDLGDDHRVCPRGGEILQLGSGHQLELIRIPHHEGFQSGHAVGIDDGSVAIDIEDKAVEGTHHGAEGDVRRNAAGEIHVIEGTQQESGKTGERVVAGLLNRHRCPGVLQFQRAHLILDIGQVGGGGRLGLAPLLQVGRRGSRGGIRSRRAEVGFAAVAVGGRRGAGGG